MSQEIIRCPYCVQGSEFRPMVQSNVWNPKESFLCLNCGHAATPDDPYAKCACARCLELNQIATRLQRDRPTTLTNVASS
jgi:DNA-directed RNA polymerase subunit RPC12/RpoP